ncbi:MAG: PorP/SprF family type IX secretion system membrane protein [Ferruginibacter sp.]
MKYILTAFLAAAIATGNAQQLQTSSLNDIQGVLQNPSMAGVQQTNYIGASYRTQWSGIAGSPKTATVFGSFDMPKQKAGIGGYIYSDKTGPTSRTGVELSLAKHIVTDNGNIFSMGIESRFQQYALDKTKLTAALGNDPAIGGGDTRFKYDAGFGIAYITKTIQLGASVSQLVQSKLNFYSGNLSTTEAARLYRHYYFHGAYKWNVDGVTTITPNFIVTYLPNAPTDFQIAARIEHREIFWWGLGYRSKQSFMASVGININKKFSLGYAYDDYLTPISHFDGASNGHEVILRFNFQK